MRPLSALCLLSAWVLLASCATQPARPLTPLVTPSATLTPGTPVLRVLFIGNSLTYTNDLPATAALLAKRAGLPRLEHTTLALPDVGLPEHWDDGTAARMIAEGDWDVVVLQQGPSALPESRSILRDYTRRFADLILGAGAQPALLAVWPEQRRFSDFPRAVESYALAAGDVGGLLIPAGAGWLAAWRQNPCLKLYSRDGLHPSPDGTALAALLTVAVLYRRATAELAGALGSPLDEAAVFVAAADEALTAAEMPPGAAKVPYCPD